MCWQRSNGAQNAEKRQVLAATAVTVLVAACSSNGSDEAPQDTESPQGDSISVWAHQGQESEVEALQQAVDAFHEAQDEVTVDLQLVPEADYTSTITTTGAGELGDVLEFDGPMMASLAYSGKLAPLDDLLDSETVNNQLESALAQNTNPTDDALYGVSQFDAGLALFGNASLLDAAGVDYPDSLEDAWTAEEFEAALQKLADNDDDGEVLDIKEAYGAEWPTFGFLPVAWSSGHRILDNNQADGHINHADVVDAVEQFASWRDFIDANADDQAFQEERVALSWVGHWMYNPYEEALGEDLVVLPLPDFGVGTKSGQGSWAWGINPESTNPDGAAAFLDFLVTDDQVAAMTSANAAPPATSTALEDSELYGEDGPLAILAQQLDLTCGAEGVLDETCVAVPRPITPAYPVISQKFSEAFFGVYEGGDAQELLDQVAKEIDLDFADNDGYGMN